MRKAVALTIIAGSLLACSYRPSVVKVPVAAPCPAPPELVRPHLPAADLNAYTPPGEVQKALLGSLEVLRGYAAELEKLLDGYRPGTGDR